MDKKVNPKEYVLPHSKAKLDFFGNYLEIYLEILLSSDYFSRINVFDLFCGTGIYEDGRKGSPIIAFNIIQNLKTKLQSTKSKVTLFVNDGESEKIDKVKEIIESQNKHNICVEFYNKDFEEIKRTVINKLNIDTGSVRNLIFLDPYGYKSIHKNDIESILKNGKTEIVLFLPISHMHRFKNVAIEDYDNSKYEKLRNFIYEFFPENHPIKNERITVKEFIGHIKESLTFFSKYFSASYFIQRDKANFNALFFITPHIYGLEKIIQVKWKLDPQDGSGYAIKRDLNQYVIGEIYNSDFNNNIENLIKKGNIDNRELYKYTLLNNRLPTHVNEILKKLQDESKINVFDIELNKEARRNSFYVNYKYYCQSKKVIISYK